MGENTNLNKWDYRHRKWQLPSLPWIMKQTWNDLLYAHYPIKLEALQKLVPNMFPLDSYNGMGWIGVIPFHITGIRIRGLLPIPGMNRFPELNVRTYVTLDGKPGIYFFSLDAAHFLAANSAKLFYHLPYRHADILVKKTGATIDYESRRKSKEATQLKCTYKPISQPFLAAKGSFEEWMAERYCIYTLNKKGRLFRCDVLHSPWLLQQAEAKFYHNTILSKQGIYVDSDKPILHFSKRKEVRIWPLIQLNGGFNK